MLSVLYASVYGMSTDFLNGKASLHDEHTNFLSSVCSYRCLESDSWLLKGRSQ